MNTSMQRRIDVASCWASSRIAVLDRHECYEDSYAITQEFREWITSSGCHPEELEASVLKAPRSLEGRMLEKSTDTDEVLEI